MSNQVTGHTTRLADTEKGYLPECSCGWKGYETDRMSDDYAWSNANEQLVKHRRIHRTDEDVSK